ncbi:hypothetical protein HK104_001923 [Borealophlyctis nickersoniae]|nr:hypothetical protein HK104_001923 [Borealophlyctis nickersoniae]
MTYAPAQATRVSTIPSEAQSTYETQLQQLQLQVCEFGHVKSLNSNPPPPNNKLKISISKLRRRKDPAKPSDRPAAVASVGDTPLECGICGSSHRKFWCTDCLGERLKNNKAQTDQLDVERQALAGRIEAVLGSGAPATGIGRRVEVAASKVRIKELEQKIAEARKSLQEDREKIRTTRAMLASRRQTLAKAHASLDLDRTRIQTRIRRELEEEYIRYHQVSDVLMQSRRLLVRELVSVFRLRRVQRMSRGGGGLAASIGLDNSVATLPSAMGGLAASVASLGSLMSSTATAAAASAAAAVSSSMASFAPGGVGTGHGSTGPSASGAGTGRNLSNRREGSVEGGPSGLVHIDEPPEYRIVNVAFSTYGDYASYPREKLNAGLGHVIHMTILLSHYLNITLPFQIVNRGSKSFVKAQHFDGVDSRDINRPLHTHKPKHPAITSLAHSPSSTIATPPPPPSTPFNLDLAKVIRLHTALRSRPRLNASRIGEDGVGLDRTFVLPKEVLEEGSDEEEEDGGGWHMVESMNL